MHRIMRSTLTIFGILAGGFIVFDEALVTRAQAAHELDGRDIAKGETLYNENCAVCHGINLEGQKGWQRQKVDGIPLAPPHDETGHTWHHDNQLLFFYTKLGGADLLAKRGISNFKSGMPGFDGVLSDEDIWDTLGYIRSTWPERIQDIQDARNPEHE